MLNLCTKHVVLNHEITWINETYGGYVSRQENNKADHYFLQEEYNPKKWHHVKIDLVNNENTNIE